MRMKKADGITTNISQACTHYLTLVYAETTPAAAAAATRKS